MTARDRDLKVLRIITGIFFFVVVAQAFMLYTTVSRQGASVPLAEAIQHRNIPFFSLAAVGMAVLSFVLRYALGPKGEGEWTTQRRVAFLKSRMVAIALSDSVAIYGFVAGSVAHNFEIGIPFFCAAGILFTLHWPRA